MRKIDVDDEVYAWLEKQAVGFEDDPNSVLRRLAGLGGGATRQVVDQVDGQKNGKLLPLIKAGRLRAGDTLVWRRPRKNEIFRATLTEHGCLRIDDGSVHTHPSGAAQALVGHQINGWDVWKLGDAKLNDLK